MRRLAAAPVVALCAALSWFIATPAEALPPAPAPLVVQAEEVEALAKGEVVVRYGGPNGETVAFTDVKASPPAVMRAVMNLPPRKGEVGGLKSLDIYRNEPSVIGARWEAGLGPYTLAFHVLYEFDIAKGWCVYALDPSRENDLQSTAGSYQAYAIDGGSRLVYRAKADPTSPLPDWAKKRVAFSSAVEMVGGMKRRAEANP